MAADVTITWTCNPLEYYVSKDDYSKVVHTVHFTVKAVSTTTDSKGNPLTGEEQGAVEFEKEDYSGFIAYDSLTHDQVLDWVQNVLGADRVTDIENSVNAIISEKKAKTTIIEDKTWS